MAAALMPALQTGGRMALAQLPGVLSAVKSKLPGAYNQVVDYFGKTSKTPEQVVATAVNKNDRFMGQAILETMLRNGVTASFITKAAPLFTEAELKSIVASFADLDGLERGIADKTAAQEEGDPDIIFAHDNVHIERLCRAFGVSSSELADLMAFVKTRGPAQITRYQRYEKANGRKHL